MVYILSHNKCAPYIHPQKWSGNVDMLVGKELRESAALTHSVGKAEQRLVCIYYGMNVSTSSTFIKAAHELGKDTRNMR